MKPTPGEAAVARHHLRRPVTTTSAGDGIRKGGMKPTTFQLARTDREVYEAKLAQLRYEQEAGLLINAAEVHAEFAKQVLLVRDGLLRLPDRLVAILLGVTDARRMRELIDIEVRSALRAFHGP